MSHIVSIKTEVRDAVAAASACQRLKLPAPKRDRFQLFSGQVEGLGIQLPDWKYPVVADTKTGRLQYDNYGGRWGKQEHLDRLLQIYSVEKCRLEARRKGYSVSEQSLPGGAIKLTILSPTSATVDRPVQSFNSSIAIERSCCHCSIEPLSDSPEESPVPQKSKRKT